MSDINTHSAAVAAIRKTADNLAANIIEHLGGAVPFSVVADALSNGAPLNVFTPFNKPSNSAILFNKNKAEILKLAEKTAKSLDRPLKMHIFHVCEQKFLTYTEISDYYNILTDDKAMSEASDEVLAQISKMAHYITISVVTEIINGYYEKRAMRNKAVSS